MAAPQRLRGRYFPMTLSQADIEALQPGEWVTDDAIDYYFRYLKYRHFRNNKKYVYIPVTIATLLTERPVESSPEHIAELASDANALDYESQCLQKPKSIRVAFLPIFGDGHWSLLVYRNVKHRPLPEFLHFNSYLNSTRDKHTQCARTALINLLYVFRANDPSMKISKESYRLVVKNCPQQTNGNDCGVWVCMYAYILSGRLAKREQQGRMSPMRGLIKRLSTINSQGPSSSSSSSIRSKYRHTQTPPDTLSFAGKDPHKDETDPEELEWKIKDKDAVGPDEMRTYITNVIYSTTFSQGTTASL
ncbi:hypothetical protein GGF46_002002 [Coemansia sp. RSA 552]|nr:hypothetical protein GGF46_002002 [Coemansia sp. RSA 552]